MLVVFQQLHLAEHRKAQTQYRVNDLIEVLERHAGVGPLLAQGTTGQSDNAFSPTDSSGGRGQILENRR